jgi:hypothetical protein
MLFWTKVLDPPLPVMPEYVNGPQVPLAALVTHLAPELLADGLAEVGLELGDELVMVGLGETGLGVPGSGAPVLGVPVLGEPVLGEAVVGEPGSGVAELDEEDYLRRCAIHRPPRPVHSSQTFSVTGRHYPRHRRLLGIRNYGYVCRRSAPMSIDVHCSIGLRLENGLESVTVTRSLLGLHR